MFRFLSCLFLLTLITVNCASAKELFTKEYINQVTDLRDKALTDSTAYNITESLTSEVGARLAGSPGDAKAVAWAVAKFKELGFDKEHVMTFSLDNQADREKYPVFRQKLLQNSKILD